MNMTCHELRNPSIKIQIFEEKLFEKRLIFMHSDGFFNDQ